MAKIVKWGFGMAPFKKESLNKYKNALYRVESFLSNYEITIDNENYVSR